MGSDSLKKRMAEYFPDPVEQSVYGNRQLHYHFGNLEVIFTPVPGGGQIDLHHHDAAQIGMCFEGRYLMQCADHQEVVFPMENLCNVRPNVKHGSLGGLGAGYVSLDFKRNNPEDACASGNQTFISSTDTEELTGGCRARFVSGPWFDVLYGWIPAGRTLPRGSLDGEMAGTVVSGKCLVRVAEQQQACSGHKAFFAPKGAAFEVCNNLDQEAHITLVFLRI